MFPINGNKGSKIKNMQKHAFLGVKRNFLGQDSKNKTLLDKKNAPSYEMDSIDCKNTKIEKFKFHFKVLMYSRRPTSNDLSN